MTASGRIRTVGAAAAAFWFFLAPGAPRAMDTADCLGCHGDRSIVEQGGKHLFINPAQFARTPHAEQGCPSCHASVTDSHPDDRVRPSRAKCADCHAEVEEAYAKTPHAAGASCTDCHNPHAVSSSTAVSAQDVNRQCANCHDRTAALASHGKWLPQAALHLDGLPCISCHNVSKQYVITLYLEKREAPSLGDNFRLATRAELTALAMGQPVERLIDRNGDGALSVRELRDFHEGGSDDLRLRGTMMPETISHNFSTMDNRWDCTFCHTSGPNALQKSFVAFPDEGGRYTRLEVEKGAILDLLYGSPNFYMLGASRNDTLSLVGLAVIACGLAVPVCHGTMRLLTRRNRKEG